MLGFPLFSVALGAIVAFAFPGLFDSHFKRKKKKEAFARLCRIVGITIIIYAIVSWLADIIQQHI